MTKETLELFLELLKQVNINPVNPGADQDWLRVTKARDEIQAEIKNLEGVKK